MSDGNIQSRRIMIYLSCAFLALVLAITVIVRIRLLQLPLERDEGEYAYMGQLLLDGIPPYVNAYTMKLPGVSAVYALFMICFGQSAAGIHTGLLLTNLLCILFVYLLARHLSDGPAAALAGTAYALLSLSQGVMGTAAHATHFVMLFVLTGLVLQQRQREAGNLLLFISGICFGIAFMMKQHAALFCVFALLLQLRYVLKDSESRIKSLLRCALLSGGMIIPYALFLIWIWRAGAFAPFWFWTVRYAQEYTNSGAGGFEAFKTFINQCTAVAVPQFPLWIIAAIGGLLLIRRKNRGPNDTLIIGFTFFSFLSLCPGLFFREHYFIMLLPANALLIGIAVESYGHTLFSLPRGRYLHGIPFFFFMAAVGYGLDSEKEYFLTMTPTEVSRTIYGLNPFPEALTVARYLKEQTTPDDRILVLGSEPEIYFYAHRLSATGHIYMYGLMEEQPLALQMQQEMIRESEAAHPRYIVTVNCATSWLIRPTSPRAIIDWGERYTKERYEKVGIIDSLQGGVHSVWGNDINGYTPTATSFLSVYKRKENPPRKPY